MQSTRPRARLLAILLATACAFLIGGAGFGQTITGTVQGYISDVEGGAIPGATVTVTNQDTGIARAVISDANGFYSAKALQVGTYSVTAELSGMQTTQQSDVSVLVGQIKDVNLTLEIESTSEVITVTSEAPIIEVSRSGAANYIDEVAIESLPTVGRDFTDFAILTPGVQRDTSRGFLTIAGQRGMYSGLSVDGADNKSTFFGYGRGGEATENDGLIIAQDTVRQFQVITNGFSAEYGRHGGAFVNVVTKSGTNEVRGSAFYYFRDDSLAEDLPSSPLDDFNDRDGSRPVDTFDTQNYGVSIGGPFKQDRTHYYFGIDQRDQDIPFTRFLTNRGGSVYDLIMQRAQSEPAFAALVDGFDRNADGSATGLFTRSVSNQILFGKLDHQISDANLITLRANWTDFERTSEFLDEESLKTEDTLSIIASMTSVVGSRGVNEFRIQTADDNLDRLSLRVGTPIEAQVRFRWNGASVGKFDFLPIFVEESQLQVKNDFSYLFGAHDMKFGVDYSKDDLAQLFAGSRDGRYDFRSPEDFLSNNASAARIWFGDSTYPNYDETQTALAAYGQDSLKRDNLTLNYGLRYTSTDNPDGLDHLHPDGRQIPDTENLAPRFGFAMAQDEGRSVLRGGIGFFFGRTPTLLFANQVQANGVPPNYGRITVGPGENGYVPLGTPINNENPPPGIIPAISYVDPEFDDAQTLRASLGWERELGGGWSGGIDAVYAEATGLQRNTDFNRVFAGYDEYGRPMWNGRTGGCPGVDGVECAEILVRQSRGDSEYQAVTLKVNRRFTGRYQFNAHYTWGKDRDTDSNERSATGVTISDTGNLDYDWGLSNRDVEHRLVVTGMIQLPADFQVSGILNYQSGRPYTLVDNGVDFRYCSSVGWNCPDYRAVMDGLVVGRNTERNESIQTVDVRVGKFFRFGNDMRLDVFVEAFNLFDQHSFNVGFNQRNIRNGNVPDDFGIPGSLNGLTRPRRLQIGGRFSF
ncbi:MAG: TonB-dependent receptor [Holophagales bacterium]|nr:TonB-dependent receptor [Holophagales bacterium]MYD21565.1 TonB-dependent receptor [Holophagales bacterium]MYI31767.1 TonB-dependent receptor [Holophagales bacterium]